ncbi:MAG: 50S ribosomal protein L9 [Desulfobulbaceae bacterium]|nr:50S ribosomal protein L9 [Desulfobulbaceae bacterium]
MDVILKELIDTLGEEGDVVKVKGGYGRNFLLPQRKAILATKASLAVLEKEKAAIEARKAAMRTDAESIAKKIAGLTVVIEQRAGDEDKLFGSVTTADIADKLETLFKDSREEFESKWDDIKVFIEYGIISQPEFYDRAKKFCLLKNSEGKYFTLEEYENFVKPAQQDNFLDGRF